MNTKNNKIINSLNELITTIINSNEININNSINSELNHFILSKFIQFN